MDTTVLSLSHANRTRGYHSVEKDRTQTPPTLRLHPPAAVEDVARLIPGPRWPTAQRAHHVPDQGGCRSLDRDATGHDHRASLAPRVRNGDRDHRPARLRRAVAG